MTAFSVSRDEDSAPFFDAAARHELAIRRCERCERFYPPHQHTCGDGGPLRWVPAAGTATLVAWAVDHGPPVDPALASPGGDSSVLGLVELDEGPWMYAPVVGADGAELHEGAKLAVRFVRPGDGEVIPAFAPI
jgi:uncharacterized OB-fold protein